MSLYPKGRMSVLKVQKYLFMIFGVGVLGFLLPFTQPYFEKMTPFALLLSVYLLAIYHPIYTKKEIVAFVSIYLFGFFIEVIGVHTGAIFGNYSYSTGLGIKVFDTPLLIGANWLFLSYCCTATVSSFIKSRTLIILLAPLLLLSYDALLEQLAPAMKLWEWEGEVIPLRNYGAWWLIGTICIATLVLLRINTKNSMAIPVFVAQFLFFLLIFLFT